MKAHLQFAVPALAAACAMFALATPTHAASVIRSTTAPAIGVDDIANYGAVSSTDKWFYENSTAGAAKGQTFTTGNAAVLLKSITYRIASGASAAPTKTYAIRIGTVAGSTLAFTRIASETASQSVAWAAGDYVTWTFAAPVLLQANTAYGIDVGMTGSTSGWQTGIPYLTTTSPIPDDTSITVQTPYDAWSVGSAFNADPNNDGADNGLAFLLGASGPNVSALDKLPAVSHSSGNLILTFSMLNSTSRGSAALNVQHSIDLGISDAWESALVPDADNTVNDVVFDITAGSPNGVVATIPVSKAASGKLFGRLNSESAP